MIVMSTMEYVKLTEVNPNDLLLLLNKQKIREHLINHDLFDVESIGDWVKSKVTVDSTSGCRIRAIMVDQQLVGWCGIQLEDKNYEMAVVIDDKSWGLGKRVFYDILSWAKDLGHEEIFIHFLYTRPAYNFLRRIATRVYESELLGSKFTTYQLTVK